MPVSSFKCLHKYHHYHPGKRLPKVLWNNPDRCYQKVRVEGSGKHFKMLSSNLLRGENVISPSMVRLSPSVPLTLRIIRPIIKAKKTKLREIRKSKVILKYSEISYKQKDVAIGRRRG